jgi:hypothetical protein
MEYHVDINIVIICEKYMRRSNHRSQDSAEDATLESVALSSPSVPVATKVGDGEREKVGGKIGDRDRIRPFNQHASIASQESGHFSQISWIRLGELSAIAEIAPCEASSAKGASIRDSAEDERAIIP